MIKINLLPVREERRRMGARQEQMFFVLILILVFIGVFYWHSTTNKKIKNLRGQITQAEDDIRRLDKIVKEVEQFKKDKKILEGKIEVIDKLKKGRQVQVHYMDELNKALPSQVWVEFYQQRADTLILRGKSLSTDDIASFMRNLEASVYFDDIRLDQTSQKEMQLGGRSVRVNDFSIRLLVVPGAGA
ncbi:MAG: PilN domain-containing protein [bacterium]|nr:PilN domain-containing protein [bacterium]